MRETKLFTGNANRPLAQAIANKLGIPLERAEVTRFSDGEIRVELRDNVRDSRAVIIQPTCAPANDTLMELMLLADALHRSAAGKIIAVIPYYGYARQDRRPGYSRTPITARIVANMIEATDISHIVCMDLHTTQIQGFFNLPVDNLSASRLFIGDIKSRLTNDTVVISPDIGGIPRARATARSLGLDIAIIDKRRPKANVSEVMNIIGNIEDKHCVLIDDLIDTAGTLCHAADALMEKGAKSVVAYCTHPILSGQAISNLNNSAVTELVVTDTIPIDPLVQNMCHKIRVISTADIFAETIRRLDNGESISELSN